MDDLAFYTTDQLINEILKRETFNGMIIANRNEYKGGDHLKQNLMLCASKRLTVDHIAAMTYIVLESLS